jgi:flavin-dependent dehydrogenase
MATTKFIRQLERLSSRRPPATALQDGARVAVMGGGPAGAFFGYFLLAMARRVDLRLQVDIYEPRDFAQPGPAGCNMCGGILYEGLVQKLAAEGIALPPGIVQGGIDACTLHMDVGSRPFETPAREKRIASVYRGAGPRGSAAPAGQSLDGYLLARAQELGANLLPARVEAVERVPGGLQVQTRRFGVQRYDLLAVAAGVNTSALKLFPAVVPGYRPPATLQLRACEYRLSAEAVEHYLGSAFHVFLLDLPGLDFAGIIPKGEYATVAMLGRGISPEVFDAFLNAPEVKACLPPGWRPDQPACQCAPRINVGPARQPFGDRVVFLGDSGVSRLYKDGIGAAYRAAKAAANTAVFHGVSADDFRRHFQPVYRRMTLDNVIGRFVFWTIRQIQHRRFARRAVLAMVARERPGALGPYTMSAVLWDTFSGNVTYREVLLRSLHPAFLGRLGLNAAAALVAPGTRG